MNLTSNTILITGGCSGIGLALARTLQRKDNTVIVCDKVPERVEAIRQSDPELHAFHCDVTNDLEVVDLIQKITAQFDHINILVNNAGVIDHVSILSDGFDHQHIAKNVDTNFVAPLILTRLFLPMLLRQNESAIVNIGSALAFVPRPIAPLYCATKAALHSVTKSLRVQLAGTSIKIFEVLPPTVDTQMTKHSRVFKITTDQLARAVVKGIQRNRYEIPVGYSSLLHLACRIAPTWMDRVAASTIWEKKEHGTQRL
jgi:uncharacterized oxidoreductase